MIGEVVPRLIAFILLPIYTNYLTPSDYGMISYTNAVVMFLFFVAVLSMNSYALRYYFEYKSEDERKRMLGNVFLFIGFVNIAILGICWVVVPVLIEHYDIQVEWAPYMKLAILSNFLEVFSVIPLVLYRVRRDAVMFVTLNLSRVILQFLLTYIFIVNLEWGVLGHFYGRLFPLAVYLIIYYVIMYRNVIFNVNFKQIKEGLKYAVPLLPGAIAYYALSFSDRVILERNVDLAMIGIYNIAYTLSFALTVINQGVYKAIEPEIYSRWAKEGFKEFMEKSQSVFYMILYSGAIALSLFAREIFMVMASEQYLEGFRLVPVIVIGVIMTGQNVIFNTLLSAEKNTKAIGIATLIGAGVSLAFNISLVPIYGIWAASLAMAVSFFMMNLMMYFFVQYNGKKFMPELFALGVYVLSTFSVTYLWNLEFSWLNVAIKIAVFVVTVCILHFAVFRTNRYFMR